MQFLALITILISLNSPGFAGQLYGCNYEEEVCVAEEVCVEDGLFGRCQVEPFDVYQWDGLEKVELELLEAEMLQLTGSGEGWASPATQCVITYFLFTRRFDLPYDTTFCNVRNPTNVLAVVQVLEGNMILNEAVRGTEAVEEEDDQILDGTEELEPEDPVGETEKEREAILDNIVNELIPNFQATRDQRGLPQLRSINDYSTQDVEEGEGEEVQQGLSLEEEQVLNDMLRSVINGEQPDLSSLSDPQLDKFINYIQVMRQIVRDQPSMTEGRVRKSDADPQKFLLKKDSEQIPQLNNGLENREHKIVKGKSEHVDHQLQRIQGNKVYIKLNKKLQDKEKLVQLMSYLEENIGRPRNLSFDNIRVNNNEVSFTVVRGYKTPKHDLLNDLAGGGLGELAETAADNGNTQLHLAPASEVAEAVYKRKAEIAEKIPGIAVDEAGTDPQGRGDQDIVVVTLVVCGAVVAVLVGLLGMYVYRNRSEARNSIKRLAADLETQPGKTYEELCRQRMAGKGERPEPLSGAVTTTQRLGSQGEPSPPGNVKSPRHSTSSWSEEPITNTNMDISTGHMILSYLEEYVSREGRVEEEWTALHTHAPNDNDVSVAFLNGNSTKNRRDSVLPYSAVRVKLQSLAGDGAEYINASPIYDHDPQSSVYIVTQGPLPDTLTDFWQMVWEQGSVVIVNLTKTMEDGRAMCHRYWPENGSEVYGVFEIHLVSEHIWCEDYLVRSFYLKNLRTNETRTVTQFHLLSWPEDGVPASSKSLLEFRRKVNKSYRGRSCPIVVHCSDGAGRSGTYCLLDMVLNRINKGVKEIDIAATLEHLRDQRMKLVRTKEQYELVLTCVAEEVEAILKALPQ